MGMRKTLKAFSFFEVILYLGLFSLLATALLTFSWDVLDLSDKNETGQYVFSDARFVSERLGTLVRKASGIDTEASVLDDSNGKLVLNQIGSSDTVTVELVSGRVMLTESGSEAVALHSLSTQVASLTFQKYGTSEDGSEYVGYTLVFEAAKNDENAPSRYQAATTLESGAFIRNSGL